MAKAPKYFLIHEQRILMLALLAGLPALIVAMVLLWVGNYDSKLRWTLGVLMFGFWWACAFAARERVASPLRTLANLLEAMREGDYSIRLRGASYEESLGEVMQQINAMSSTLRAQRLGALEATTLLRKVMEEIDVSVFAFDAGDRLRLVNRAGERLLGQAAERLLGHTAASLGLSECLSGEPHQTLQRTFPGAAGRAGRWGVLRSAFREGGLPHQLLVISDLTRALREEELQAWQRLVRVLGHELNNSLTPIKSIAGSLASLLSREPLPGDWQDDTRRGLSIIASRSEALSRFMGAYAKLARLPRPRFASVDVGDCIRHVAGLETRIKVNLEEGPGVVVQGDRDQLEQLLINLLRNAVDASLETSGSVTATWSKTGSAVEIHILDEGPGLSNTANLFVPFFTTQAGRIGHRTRFEAAVAEAHGGTLNLENRSDGTGAKRASRYRLDPAAGLIRSLTRNGQEYATNREYRAAV